MLCYRNPSHNLTIKIHLFSFLIFIYFTYPRIQKIHFPTEQKRRDDMNGSKVTWRILVLKSTRFWFC